MSSGKFLRCWVLGFLLVRSAPAEIVNFPMGSAGQVVMNYGLEATRDPQFKYTVSIINTLYGTLKNETKYPVSCAITPVPSSESRLDVLVLEPRVSDIPPGELRPFKKTQSSVSQKSVSILSWQAACRSKLSYKFVNAKVEKKFTGGSVIGVMGLKGISFQVLNDSDSPIEILWNDSSIIDMTRTAGRIMHDGVKFGDREQSFPNTIVPPQAKIEDTATPTKGIEFISGENAHWFVPPLLPTELPVEKLDEYLPAPIGRKITLFLQLLVEGKKVPVSLPFEIVGVSAVLGSEK